MNRVGVPVAEETPREETFASALVTALVALATAGTMYVLFVVGIGG